jgi:hypothetical protein
MKRSMSRLAAAVLLAFIVVLISGATASKGPVLQPNKLVIISTTDVKGKTGPCG